jgi:hypothetical protein
MRILGPVSEDEVLECFVRAERDSERYGETLRKLEHRVGGNPERFSLRTVRGRTRGSSTASHRTFAGIARG